MKNWKLCTSSLLLLLSSYCATQSEHTLNLAKFSDTNVSFFPCSSSSAPSSSLFSFIRRVSCLLPRLFILCFITFLLYSYLPVASFVACIGAKAFHFLILRGVENRYFSSHLPCVDIMKHVRAIRQESDMGTGVYEPVLHFLPVKVMKPPLLSVGETASAWR